MSQWLALFVAGGCGVCLRHGLATLVDARVAAALGERGLPASGTLVVNLLGCLAIGALATALAPGSTRQVVLVGLLGGFTTYSSFALTTVELTNAGRLAAAGLQVGLHLVGGALMVALGAWIAGRLTH